MKSGGTQRMSPVTNIVSATPNRVPEEPVVALLSGGGLHFPDESVATAAIAAPVTIVRVARPTNPPAATAAASAAFRPPFLWCTRPVDDTVDPVVVQPDFCASARVRRRQKHAHRHVHLHVTAPPHARHGGERVCGRAQLP